jgi:DNA polymerase/3'-5' exonuclease PolX
MSKGKVPRDRAMIVAREINLWLEPLVERKIFAGSLRRLKPMVGDIEVLYIPKIEMRADPLDLLGHQVPCNLVSHWLGDCLHKGILAQRLSETGRPSWGAVNKLATDVVSGIGVDFFEANLSNWVSLLVCRTGPAELNTRICMAAEKLGQKWNPYIGFVHPVTEELLFAPPSEEALFRHVNLPYAEPKDRI